MVEFAFEKGGVGAVHSHPHVQSSYVAEGRFEVTIDGIKRDRRNRRGVHRAVRPGAWRAGAGGRPPGRYVHAAPRRFSLTGSASQKEQAGVAARFFKFRCRDCDQEAASSEGAVAAAIAAAASACAFWRAATRSCAFLPGCALFGLERASRLVMPASSRKRSDAVGRQRAVGEPMLDAVGVDLRRARRPWPAAGSTSRSAR